MVNFGNVIFKVEEILGYRYLGRESIGGYFLYTLLIFGFRLEGKVLLFFCEFYFEGWGVFVVFEVVGFLVWVVYVSYIFS